MTERKSIRKGNTPIYVWVTPEEKAAIQSLARTTGGSTSAFLRTLGLGYEPKCILDNLQVDALLRINADLGRLGGLLKLWLNHDPRTAKFDAGTMRAVLSRISRSQDEMQDAIRAVVMPRAKSGNR